MAEFFNRANLLQGSVAPIAGGNVSVPTDDPNNKLLAQGFGNLASRLDAFKTTAFNVAGERAKAAGTLYGARNAPTADQLALANATGQTVDLPGDATSLNIFNQAAYAGSLSLLEDSVEIAGRRALTEAMAEAAADPTLDPQTFTAKLDTVVQEYSAQMATVSPTSAGKVNAALGMVANSQVVSFSREFMAKAIKQRVNEAKENANTIIDSASDIITGHTVNGDVTLLDSIKSGKNRVRSILEKSGVKEDYILRSETRFEKEVKKAQEAIILDWARSTEKFTDNPTGAYRELRKLELGEKAEIPDNIKDVWAITEPGTRNAIVKELINQTTAINRVDELENKRSDLQRQNIIDENTQIFNKALTDLEATWQERSRTMQAAVISLNNIGEDTTKLQEIIDAGPITRIESVAQDVLHLSKLKSMGVLSLFEINKARLNEEDQAKFLNDLLGQRDKNVKGALATIKNDRLFADVNLNADPNQDDTKQALIRQRYNQAQDIVLKARRQFEENLRKKVRSGETVTSEDFFDAQQVAEDAVKTVRTEMLEKEITILEERIEKSYKILDDIEKRDGTVFPRTEEGLRQALRSEVPGFLGLRTNPRYPKDQNNKFFGEGLKISNRLKNFEELRDLRKRLDLLEDD